MAAILATRLLSAAMALSLGHGGQTLMQEVIGLAMCVFRPT
jgi:hypothetical protein